MRDLESGGEGWEELERICGGNSIVAARLGGAVVTIWSSKEEMGWLHTFDVRNHDGMEDARADNIRVNGKKVVLLLRDRESHTSHLIALQEGEHHWENKILESFTTILAYWYLADVVFESPFLVCAGSDRSTGWIKVFQLAADELMEDLNSSASLIKTVRFPRFDEAQLLCNDLLFGCRLRNMAGERSLVLFEKTALLDTAILPEQTPRNRIHLGFIDYCLVDMNTTSVVFIQKVTGQENNLCKKDFWISRTTVA